VSTQREGSDALRTNAPTVSAGVGSAGSETPARSPNGRTTVTTGQQQRPEWSDLIMFWVRTSPSNPANQTFGLAVPAAGDQVTINSSGDGEKCRHERKLIVTKGS
jgi:hypothetical protein